MRIKIVLTFSALVAANALVWIVAFAVFAPHHPVLLGTALLAYTFGLRHAVDADHICAIDNATRKLMHEGKRPVCTGLFFSLGHSSVVVALTAAIAAGAVATRGRLTGLEGYGGIVGTGLSAAFLFVIATLNAFVLFDVLRALSDARAGLPYCQRSLDASLDGRGLLGRLFRPALRFVGRSRDMYAVGLLFGLGFDTATEVGLLGIAVVEAGKGLPVWTVLIFPALFTAGMSLVDTADGVLMLAAFGWAFLEPARKLYYNAAITAAAVAVAAIVGGIELAGIAGGSVQTGWLGYAVAGGFGAAWAASVGWHVLRRQHGPPASAGTASRIGMATPSASSQASKCSTYAFPNESSSARR